MANISKSTPYVRYREKFTSNVHLGTIHVESEYLDNTRPTTIESIHGMTWHNRIYNENKELPVLSDRNIVLNTKQREYFDTGEKRVPIDEIHGLEDCVANSDGTYTYKVETVEGDYAETYNGINHITSSSNGLSGEVEITYNTNEEDITGSLVFDMVNGGNVTIENSKQGELTGAILKGNTLVNLFDTNLVLFGNKKSTVEKGVITIPINNHLYNNFEIPKEKCSMFKPSTTYTLIVDMLENSGQPQENETEQAMSFGLNSFSETIVKNEGSNYNCMFNHREVGRKVVTFTTHDKETYDEKARGIQFRLETYYNATQGQQKLSIVILEGNYTNVDIPYFEGMASVKMPVLKTTGKNVFDLANSGLREESAYDKSMDGYGVWSFSVQLQPNKEVTISRKNSEGYNLGLNLRVHNENTYNGGQWLIANHAESGNKNSATITTNSDGYIWFIFSNNFDKINQILDICEYIQIEYGTQATTYEPYKSNILTVNEGVTLRGIGDVRDTLNLLTGELVERTEELELNVTDVKFDGVNENGLDRFIVVSSTIPKSEQSIDGNAISNNGISAYPNFNYGRDNTFSYSNSTKRFYFTFTKDTITSEKLLNKLTTNKMVIIFKRDVPVTKTVDLSIVDQNGKSQPALATYPSVTHIHASSDTLIPSGQVDFKVASSIETVTGIDFTIENGEHSDLISGMLYGETLLNVLPSPSLKNSMGYNTSTQKLNKGYENINVVDGEFKEVTLYGRTMVNIEGIKSVENPTIIITNSPMRFGKGGRK